LFIIIIIPKLKGVIKMKVLRIVYVVTVIASLVLTGFFYCKYYLKGMESAEYQKLSELSSRAFDRVNTKLAQNKGDLKASLKKLAAMNMAIEALEEEALSFKAELLVLRKERDQLNSRVAELVESKTVLEKKFHSLKELKRAIKLAKREDKLTRMKERLAQIDMLNTMDAIALAQGNRGYVTKDGKETFKSPVIRVELEPVSRLSFNETEEE